MLKKILNDNAILFDLATFGIGSPLFFGSMFNHSSSVNEEVALGATLITLGLLIRLWRKENRLK